MDDENSKQDFAEDVSEEVPRNCTEIKTCEDEKLSEVFCGQRIINEIIKQNRTICWPFMEPVDTEGLGLWDYKIKIKEPMWLNKILQKIEENKYKLFVEIAKDFRKMIENCYRYNTTDHPISKKAKRLEMFFESKLGLLSREIQQSATIAKTSDGRFSTKVNESSDADSAARKLGSNGLRDIFNGNDFDNQPHLVFDFVRCEEAIMAEDEKQASYRERKQQQLLYQQVAAVFVNGLETSENMKTIKTCPVLPEIGLFLNLNEGVLRLPELSMYNLEMGLLIPSDSLYLAKLMTSFLSTYYERNLINQRPPMTYSVWNRRLKLKLIKWFEIVMKHFSFVVAADKLCLSTSFFEAMSWKNPFVTDNGDSKSFRDLSYNQKAHIIKALCDNQTTTQSVQNNIAALPAEQLRPMDLGEDVEGNVYIYFPQFCGDDVRIYRQRQFGSFKFTECPPPETTCADQSNDTTNQQHQLYSPAEPHSPAASDKSDNEIVNVSTTDLNETVCEPVEGVCDDNPTNMSVDIPQPLSENSIISSYCEDKSADSLSVEDVKEVNTTCEDVATTVLNNSAIETVMHKSDDGSLKKESMLPSPSPTTNNAHIHTEIDSSIISDSCNSQGEVVSVITEEENDVPYSPTRKKRGKTHRQSTPEPFQEVRRSLRKRTTVNYSKMMVDGEVEEEKKPKVVNSPRKRGRKPLRKSRKPIEIEEPVSDFGSVDFEMVCDSISALHDLILTIDKEKSKAVKVKKPSIVIRNISSLLERLRWLLNELLPFETKLEKARFDVKIRLKKEHDEIVHKATTGNAFNSVDFRGDPWEEEISNKNALLSMENSSTRSGTPNPLYVEESDSGSDRELRRSRRKPKRYEEDEDYVCESSDDDLSQSLPTSHMYDENDEDRKRLLPAAMEELEEVLTDNVAALKRIITRERQDDELEGGAVSLNERRTRQRSKRENKVFRKILYLASKYTSLLGPSLLPLIRSDQSEITEVVDRVLAKDAVARQQRKAAREQEDKKRRSMQQALRQQKKEKRQRVAKEEMEENYSESVSWSPSKKNSLLADSPTYRVQENETVENVIIRLQNGKVCPALRFNDGRIAPIVRVDNDTKPAASFEDLTARFGRTKSQNVENKVPHISLTGNRRRAVASILRKPTPKKQQPPPVTSVCSAANLSEPPAAVTPSSTGETSKNYQSGVDAKPAIVTNPVSVKLVQQSVHANNSATPTDITKPTGQLINLVLSNQTGQLTSASVSSANIRSNSAATGVGSLGKFIVKVNPRVVSIARPVVPQQPLQTATIQKPATGVLVSTGQSIPANSSLPLGSVQIPLPSVMHSRVLSASTAQPQAFNHIQTSTVPVSALAATTALSSMQPQPVQRMKLVPTIVAAPVPVAQPVQIVQAAVPAQAMTIPVQPRPVLMVSQTHPVSNVAAYRARAPVPTNLQQTPRYVFTPYSQSGGPV